ncbi:MAG: glycosyltransferase [Ktedonobacteraceae bacterium]|nr:glycosyltransferase [Ktedonobacteraceae bacterium]
MTGFYFYGIQMLVVTLAVATVFYIGDVLFFFYLSLRALHSSTGEYIEDAVVHALAAADWPHYTVLCPLYREADVVPQLARAMQRLDYPTDKLQILILIQDDDAETYQALQKVLLPAHFEIVTLPTGEPRTKPRACNFGLLRAKGDYLVIYDAEDIPEPLQLKKAILTFAHYGPEVACVQAKLNVYNGDQNLITRWFSADFYQWFDAILPGLQSVGLPVPLGGTSNHFRSQSLRMVGAWDAFNVTEDCDLGLRLAHYGLKAIILDSTTYEEANSQFRNWFRQRARWIKGYMQTYLVNMRQPLRYLAPARWSQFISLQFVVGIKTGVLLVNPIMWALLAIYIFFRSSVESTYHILFPTPILYMGMFCFIFGNFFCLYSCVASCLKRGQFSFIKYTLLFPIYWFMMSGAAFVALFGLIFKPHYWGKTQHGLHLRWAHSSTSSLVEQEADALPTPPTQTGAVSASPFHKVRGSSIVDEITFQESQKAEIRSQVPQEARRSGFRDPWLLVLLCIACAASIISLRYFYQQDVLLVYKDANSHLLLARRLIDSATPGFAQLGGVWLPLPHLLMQPFIWNDYLWHSGLAGSFVSMLFYVVATTYLFLAVRAVTGDSRAGIVGGLLFALNPNILYLQATPLSELVLIATMLMACHHFLIWTRNDRPAQLILSALGTFLATLARYDAWALFMALLAGIVVVGWIKHQCWKEIEGKLLAFGMLGGLGIALWILWCFMIFGDPLYFQSGPFSSQADQAFLRNANVLYTYHNLWQSTYIYAMASSENVGLIISAIAIAAFVIFLARYRLSPNTIAGLIFTVPFVFYIVSLYTGQAAIFLAPANRIYNLRYGVEAVVPVAFFVGVLVGGWFRTRSPQQRIVRQMSRTRLLALGSTGLQVLCLGVVVLQTVFIGKEGIISLQDGLYGADCAPHSNVVGYLAQHYNGGRLLEDFYSSRKAGIDFINIDFKNVIYEGSGQLWKAALKNPASMVEWIIANPRDLDDMVARHIALNSPAFLAQFIALEQEAQGTTLYHRKQTIPLVTQTVPGSLLAEHIACAASDPRRIRTFTTANVSRPDFQAGVAFPQAGNQYRGNDLRDMQGRTGAHWIEMPLSFAQASVTSTLVTTDSNTPTLSAFAQNIRTSHAAGLRVFVAPLLYAAPEIPGDNTPHWAGGIHFSTYMQEKAWFDSYWQALQPYAMVAAQEGVEQLAIGTEEEWLEQNAPDSLWNTLIARVHNVFPRTITYDMNWSSVQLPPHRWLHNPYLNMIGVSAYFPLVEKQTRVAAQQLFQLWQSKEKSALDAFSIKEGKPLLLSEIGYRNSQDAVYHTWEAFTSTAPDPEEQALACDAAMNNIYDDPHITGTFFWAWDNASAFRLQGMPAATTIHSWYISLETT